MNRCQFTEDHHRAWGVKPLCAVLEVACSSFYKWRAGRVARAARERADARLAERIRAVHAEWERHLRPPRITAELRGDGECVNHKRVGGVMRKFAIAGLRLRKRQVTTVPESSARPVPDLFRRDFTATVPNTKYVGDITYLPVGDGEFLYLATVTDCFSRSLVGWSIADHMRPRWSPTRSGQPPRSAAAWPAPSFTVITESSTPLANWPLPVPSCGCGSRWARSAPARTTPSPNRSTRPSNARHSVAPAASTGPAPAAWPSSAGPRATTPADGTRRTDSSADRLRETVSYPDTRRITT